MDFKNILNDDNKNNEVSTQAQNIDSNSDSSTPKDTNAPLNANASADNKNEKNKESSVLNLYDIVSVFVSALVVIFLVFTFVGRNMMVSGESMMPTLQNGDRVAISALDRTYEYKDIVIVSQPNKLHKILIKRVIAVGGQTVDIDDKNGVVIVDGQALQEDYTLEPTYTRGDMEFPLTVPEGQLFVMGDNRNDSSDSRMKSVGLIDERYIMGKVVVRLFPFGKWKIY